MGEFLVEVVQDEVVARSTDCGYLEALDPVEAVASDALLTAHLAYVAAHRGMASKCQALFAGNVSQLGKRSDERGG